MQEQQLQGAQGLLCINAEKVYDWVILQEEVNQTILPAAIGAIPFDPCAPAVSNLTATCYLVNPVTGNPLPPNAEVPVVETGEREERQYVLDGTLVTLQRISFVKTLSVVIEFTGINGTTPFVFVSDEITVEIPESVYLVAPLGTRLVVRIADIDCSVSVNCVGGVLENVDLFLNVCQSVQTVGDVTVEIAADYCGPREVLPEQWCPSPTIPPESPNVFPGIRGTSE